MVEVTLSDLPTGRWVMIAARRRLIGPYGPDDARWSQEWPGLQDILVPLSITLAWHLYDQGHIEMAHAHDGHMIRLLVYRRQHTAKRRNRLFT